MSMRTLVLGGFLSLALVACGGGSSTNAGGGGSGGSTTASTTGSGGSTATGSGGATGTTSSSSTDTTPIPPLPASTYGTLVVVGDSISDQGASGQPGQKPLYYELLEQNDDTLYPAWKGKDLKTAWPSVNIVKVSKGGSEAPDLVQQLKGLPTSLPGPVLIIGTIGGNDVRAGLVSILGGSTMPVTDYQASINQAFSEIGKPDRFGAGVKVTALIANIYDPSDGTGVFFFTPENKSCPFPLSLFPKNTPTTPLLQPFEDVMTSEAAKVPGISILDLHALYVKHGVGEADPENWFHDDCIHPNTGGHGHIRGLFWDAISKL
jgi:hypothetical protein